jgi:Ca-activated chloride channel family protein
MAMSLQSNRALAFDDAPTVAHVWVKLVAPRASGKVQRAPLQLALVLDRSGSMSGDKLRLALKAAEQALQSLQPTDLFSLVVYDNQVDVLVPLTPATAAARRQAQVALAQVGARGGTNLSGGWLAGCGQVGERLASDRVGRCLLLTDGQANDGIVDVATLAARAAELRRSRVITSTLGVGADFNEALLQTLSEAGGGGFYFAQHAEQIAGFIAGEVGEALEVTARDAVLRLQGPEGLKVESLNGLPCKASGGVWTVELGSLVSEQELDPLLRLTFPAQPSGATTAVSVHASDASGALREQAEVRFAHASRASNLAQPKDRAVELQVAQLLAASARVQALALNGQGKTEEAAQVLRALAAQVRADAGGDAALLALATALEAEAETYRVRLDAVSAKQAMFDSYQLRKMRSADGFSKRSTQLVPPPPVPAPPVPAPPVPAPPVPAPAAVGPMGLVGGVLVPATVSLLAPLEQARQALVAHPDARPHELTLGGPLAQVAATTTLEAADEQALVAQAAKAWPGRLTLVVTEQPLGDRWFSHWHAATRTAVVSLAGVEALGLTRGAFVAYEMVLHGLRFSSAAYDPAALLHEESRKCLWDLCRDRADLVPKLRSGQICPLCQRELTMLGVPLEGVQRLWGAVKGLTGA